MKKQWYEELFENYAESYENESFTKGTIGECDFIEQELSYNKQLAILDIGCGTGRHAIELHKRGYNVTGIDLSDSQLKKARSNAEKAGLHIRFEKHDARSLPFNKEFDAAIMMCEGGFPLMETDEMNFEILKQASKSLTDKGILIFTTLNGLFPVYNSIDNFHAETNEEQDTVYHSSNFDIMTFRDHNITEAIDDDGNKKVLVCNERFYIPSEITWLLKTVGFTSIEIFGARLGEFSREHALTTKDFEMLVIAKK